jgi:N-alpha-acetyltransferase 30
MIAEDVEDIVLECEVNNVAALNLYDNLGFVRDKRLNRCECPPICLVMS